MMIMMMMMMMMMMMIIIIIIIITIIIISISVSKYKDLEIEIARMWKMGTEMIPVVIGALGVIKKQLKKYVDKIPGTVSIDELQKVTLLGAAHSLRKVLSINRTLWYLSPMVLDPVLQTLNKQAKDYKCKDGWNTGNRKYC